MPWCPITVLPVRPVCSGCLFCTDRFRRCLSLHCAKAEGRQQCEETAACLAADLFDRYVPCIHLMQLEHPAGLRLTLEPGELLRAEMRFVRESGRTIRVAMIAHVEHEEIDIGSSNLVVDTWIVRLAVGRVRPVLGERAARGSGVCR